MATKQFKNSKRKTIKERTEKGSLNNMLTMFNSKIEDLEFEDFDESTDSRNHPYWMDDDVGFDIPWDENGFAIPDSDDRDIYDDEDPFTESRELHTWNITYTGKDNKIKNHVVDAPDAYEANRKARKQLGISYTDIDDVSMVENKNNLEEDYLSSSEANKVYSELKSVFDDFSDNMIETVEADYDSYKEMSGEDISFEEWFRDTKEKYPDYFKYIFAIMFEDYRDSAF